MKRCKFAILMLILSSMVENAQAQWFFFPRSSPCANGQCGSNASNKNDSAPVAQDKEDEKAEEEPKLEHYYVTRERFTAPSVEIANACDEILDRLEERYGKPKTWKAFPVRFQQYRGNGIAGYTSYSNVVEEVVCFEPLASAVGGTLDHELTHAFYFYLLDSNFDLFLNEGLAQNSEYRRREALRQTVYRRYSNGEFWDLDRLYGRNSYDNALRIYHQGFSVVDFLIARGGSLWIAAFMDELVKSNDVNATMFRYYGYRNINELQSDWIDYIENGQDRYSVGAIR